MNTRLIWILLGVVAIFAAAIAVGTLYRHHAMSPFLGGDGGHSAREHDAAPFLDHFRKRLDLTDEQVADVTHILAELHNEMMGLSMDFHDKFETLRSRAWTDIRATLKEQQLSEFEKLVEELERGHSHH